jgi:hypothetical protein
MGGFPLLDKPTPTSAISPSLLSSATASETVDRVKLVSRAMAARLILSF